MAFSIYRSKTDAAGVVHLTERSPLRLSGEKGMVATYVASIKGSGVDEWHLSQQQLAQFLKKDEGEYAILFEIPKENIGGSNIYALVKMMGKVKHDRTDVIVHLVSVELKEDSLKDTWIMGQDLSGKKIFEQLPLMGSFSGGTWHLGEPDNAINATVVGSGK